MEGHFSRAYKGPGHPHTNMAKAALNMLTRTSAKEMLDDGILMTAVDTGWITDERPHYTKLRLADEGFHAPLDLVDGAARVYDPIVQGEAGVDLYGCFLKDYRRHPGERGERRVPHRHSAAERGYWVGVPITPCSGGLMAIAVAHSDSPEGRVAMVYAAREAMQRREQLLVLQVLDDAGSDADREALRAEVQTVLDAGGVGESPWNCGRASTAGTASALSSTSSPTAAPDCSWRAANGCLPSASSCSNGRCNASCSRSTFRCWW